MNKYKTFALAAITILVVVLVTASVSSLVGNDRSPISNGGYLSYSELNSLNVTPSGVSASRTNSTIYVNDSANLLVMMGPMNAQSMYSFEILGIINPTLDIKTGKVVHFTVVNVDTDLYHNFVLSSQGPPYSYYYMGNNMMGGGYQMNSMNFLPPANSGNYAFYNVTYDFSNPGTYWYLCTYPGHAENGMYGKIVVS